MEMTRATIEFVVPFLEVNHSFETMIKTLEAQGANRFTNFPNSYFLALLYMRIGDKKSGCDLLYKLREKTVKLLGQNAPLSEKESNS